MKRLFLPMMAIVFACCAGNSANNSQNNEGNMENANLKLEAVKAAGYQYDTLTTPKGRQVSLVFIKHGSIAIDVDGYMIYIDPVTMFGNDYSVLPKADLIMVTHEHHDHFDPQAIAELTGDDTRLIGSRRINELYGSGEIMEPGDKVEIKDEDITITAVPAYNITPDHLQFHPKERKDDGFVFDIDGLRIYVAGDTEDIPEMADLKDIDVAFIPVNQPYTMTPEQGIHAAEMIKPKILYPYHYGQTDLTPLVDGLKGSGIDVRVRQLQ